MVRLSPFIDEIMLFGTGLMFDFSLISNAFLLEDLMCENYKKNIVS